MSIKNLIATLFAKTPKHLKSSCPICNMNFKYTEAYHPITCGHSSCIEKAILLLTDKNKETI